MKAVELKKISFCYTGSENKVLDGIDFVAEYGEVTLLSGYSGEGKSTILSLISGIIPNVVSGKIEGEILVGGESIIGKKMSEICRKVGVVLQNADSQIIQKLVEDEIAFGCENFAFSPDKIDRQIGIVCGMMKLDRKAQTHTLSGGQKQRLITASTLAMGQKILILDEPLANLDCEGADYLMHTLRSLSGAGYAVIVVEHRLDMVFRYVDTVYNISGGKVKKIEDKEKFLAAQSVVIEDHALTHKKNDPLFELRGVAYSTHDKEILSDISFDISRGERTLLFGENGCGKTTLLRLIARLYKSTGGKITCYLEKVGTRTSKKWFKSVGVVYQNPNYQLFMPTVEKEIKFGAAREEYAEEIMDMFKLGGIKNHHPQSLSEGQKRRVSIAAVVASEPHVLLLDEPTVGQDYLGLKSLVEILNTVHDKTGNTMITVTHDMRCAEALCDHAVWIDKGTVIEQGGKDLAHRYFFRNK